MGSKSSSLLKTLALPGFFVLILTSSFPRSSLFSIAFLIFTSLLGWQREVMLMWAVPISFLTFCMITVYLATRVKVEFKWDFHL